MLRFTCNDVFAIRQSNHRKTGLIIICNCSYERMDRRYDSAGHADVSSYQLDVFCSPTTAAIEMGPLSCRNRRGRARRSAGNMR